MSGDGDPRPVPPAVGTAAYRIVQEALTNSLRHAPNAGTEVTLGWQPRALEVLVRTVGTVPGPSPDAGGRGLVGMRERVQVLGGQFEAGPTATGFAVRATLPLDEGS